MLTKLLDGRVAIVTGAASARGIGRACARIFAREGALLAILDLDAAASEATAAEFGAGHLGLACDVRDPRACERAVAAVVGRHGRVDVLANIAGISRPTRLMEVDAQEYDLVVSANLGGTFNMSRAVVPQMRAQRSGSIIGVGSVAAQRGGGVFGGAHYSAAKGAIQTLCKAMARELGPDNIRVNAIAPGLVDTDIFQGKLTPEKRREVESAVPLGRIAVPDEIASSCLYLASDLSSYVTGIVLDINGGLHIH